MQNNNKKQVEWNNRYIKNNNISHYKMDLNPAELEIIKQVEKVTGESSRKAAILTACKALLEANRGKE